MKRLNYLIVGLFFLVFLSGCTSDIKSGDYESISDEWGEINLSVYNHQSFSLEFTSLNKALSNQSVDASENGNTPNSLIQYTAIYKGTIDQEKKEFHFTEPTKKTAHYDISNGILILSDADDKALNQSFYVTTDTRLQTLKKDFIEADNDVPRVIRNRN